MIKGQVGTRSTAPFALGNESFAQQKSSTVGLITSSGT